MNEHADKRLAKRLLSGENKAFDAFFNTYCPRLYRFALARLDNDEGLAEETAQVVLCKALSKMATYRGEASMFTWLCTFCRHEISAQRKARKRAQGDTPLREDDPAIRAALESMMSVASSDPDAAVYQTEISRLVRVTLDHLPVLYADALEYKYIHGLSVKDIAGRIGKSAKAAESTLTRARDAFRDNFRTLMDEEQRTLNNGSSLSMANGSYDE